MIVQHLHPMKIQTELFLCRLLWFGSSVISPVSLRNPRSFLEDGPVGSSFLRQIQRLEKLQLLERERNGAYGQLLKLTKDGENLLSDTGDVSRWESTWSGFWTIVFFDIAEKDRSLRDDFRRKLTALRFGCLQRSLWISPFPQPELITYLQKEKPACTHCTLMEARELLGLSPGALVKASWNLKHLEDTCSEWEKQLRHIETLLSSAKATLPDWNKALDNETLAWKKVCAADPFLPLELHPKDYPTPRLFAWKKQLMQKTRQTSMSRQSTPRS